MDKGGAWAINQLFKQIAILNTHTHTSTDGGVLTAHQSTNTFETAVADESPLHVLGQEQTSLL